MSRAYHSHASNLESTPISVRPSLIHLLQTNRKKTDPLLLGQYNPHQIHIITMMSYHQTIDYERDITAARIDNICRQDYNT